MKMKTRAGRNKVNQATAKNYDEARALEPKGSTSILGHTFEGDGGAGMFVWDSASTESDDGGRVLIPDLHTGPGRWVRVAASGEVHSQWYAPTISGELDLQSLVEALPMGGGTIRLAEGVFDVPKTGVTMGGRYGVQIIGAGAGFGQSTTTTLRFRNGGDDQGCIHLDGAGCALRNVAIAVSPNGPPPTDGVVIASAKCVVSGIMVQFMARDGIAILSEGVENANGFLLEHCRLQHNGRHGLYVDGGDSNAGLVSNCDATANDGWGFVQDGGLGNTYIACHTSSNGNWYDQGAPPVGGGYKVTGGPGQAGGGAAYSTYIGCYSELNQHPGEFNPSGNTLVIGGSIAGLADSASETVGYKSSKLRFGATVEVDGEAIRKGATMLSSVPDAFASTRHGEDEFIGANGVKQSPTVALFERHRSTSPSWLQNTEAIAKWRSTWKVPFAFTTSKHPNGPMLRTYGMPFVESPFRFTREKTFRPVANEWMSITYTTNFFAFAVEAGRVDEKVFRPSIRLPSADSTPCIIGGYFFEGNTVTVRVKCDGIPTPGTYALILDVERYEKPL